MARRVVSPRRAGRRPTSHERGERTVKWFGAILGCAAIGGFAWMFLDPYLHPKPRIDATSYCPVSGPSSYTAIIIDATDTINAVQKIAIENELTHIRREVPRGGALAIYAVGFSGELDKPEFVLCNPGHAGEIDWLREGKFLAEKRWKEGFAQPLNNVLQKMLSASPEAESPLLEAMQSVSVQSFGPLRAAGNVAPKRLIIVSDMLQNSESLDIYRKIPAPAQFIKSEAYRKVRADLRDVEVAIYFIRRETRRGIQRPELMQFWGDVLAAEGVRQLHFKPLEG